MVNVGEVRGERATGGFKASQNTRPRDYSQQAMSMAIAQEHDSYTCVFRISNSIQSIIRGFYCIQKEK